MCVCVCVCVCVCEIKNTFIYMYKQHDTNSYTMLLMPLSHDWIFVSAHRRMGARRLSYKYVHVLYKFSPRSDSSS